MSNNFTINTKESQKFSIINLRNEKKFRNFQPLQKYHEIEIFKILPPSSVKGLFVNQGGGENELFVGFDTEFYFDDNKQLEFVSYQFWIDGFEEGYLFVSKNGEKIAFKDMFLFLKKLYIFKNLYFTAHFGVVDYLKFIDREDLLQNCFINNKTIFGSFKYKTNDYNRHKKEAKISIKDTMLLAGGGSLRNLGKIIGIEKVNIGSNIENMKKFYNENFDKFVEYAMNDAIIAVKYYKQFVNKLNEVLGMPENLIFKINTASGISEKFFKFLMEQKGEDMKEFIGKTEIRRTYWNDKVKKLITFVKQDFDEEFRIWENGYYGGRNETYIQGFFNGAFFDYDIKNAYPLAMLAMQDVDWNKRVYIRNDNIHILSFNDLGFIYLDFKFKDNIEYPLFPIKTEYGLVFPREGKTIVSIPEFLTAIKNGMLESFYIRDGIKFKRLETKTISDFIKMVIDERSKYPKGSMENNLWKLVANSFYGKTAQGLTGKKTINVKMSLIEGKKIMKKQGKSSITNPFIAGFITGAIRSIVGEYMNYLAKQGAVIANVTTDGFMLNKKLTDKELEGIGFITKSFSAVRYKILGDKQILELKHWSDEKAKNIILKTRGYWLEPVNENDKVLIARAGIQTKHLHEEGESDFEANKKDYEYLTENYLKANFNSIYRQSNLKNVADVIVGETDDIYSFERDVSMNFDYDLKRKPVVYYDEKVIWKGKEYIKLKIEKTEPWENVDEFLEHKNLYYKFMKKQTDINKLQNKEQIDKFFEYVKTKKVLRDNTIKSLEQAVLTNVIFILLLEGYTNKEIAEILNINVKRVEKRKYSKTFQNKILKKGIKRISEKEFNEIYEPVLKDLNLQREIYLLIREKLIDNEFEYEPSIFEVIDDKNLDF